MKCKVLIFTLITFFSYNNSIAQIVVDQALENSIDSIFIIYKNNKSPGGAISIISDGTVIYKKYFGYQSLKENIPISSSTPFNLASIAKQFTGVSIALLEEQGAIDLTDNINKFFPQFQFPDSITIQNLLDHSSGIREATVIGILAGHVNLKGELPSKHMNRKFLFDILSKECDLNFPTGTETAYTNINYVLLADIVEQVSGMAFKEFADSAIFKPLNMRNTYVEDFSDDSNVIGYQNTGSRFKRRILKNGLVGEDNVISTLEDLYLWNQNFYSNKLGNHDQRLIDKLTTSTLLNTGEKSDYNYGLSIHEYKGMKAISHDGENDIHTSFIIDIPKQKFSIICLINAIDFIDPIQKSYEVLDLFFEETTEDLVKKIDYSPVSISVQEIENRIGLYYRVANDGTGQLRRIGMNSGRLTISPSLNGKGYSFDALNNNQFFKINSAGYPILLSFESTTDGFIFTEKFDQGPWKHEDWTFKKIDDLPLDPNEYKGVYRDSQHGAKIKIKIKKSGIIAKKSIIKIPLIRLDNDSFFSPEYDALFLFKRNDSRVIQSMIINSTDFRNFKLMKK